jgi:hypothetical protein
MGFLEAPDPPDYGGRACEGDDTIPRWHCQGEMHECYHCGTQVQWDMVDHPFFGFRATCESYRAAKAKRAVTPAASEAP